jgi:membrane fusion protein (multidrug efflux system)
VEARANLAAAELNLGYTTIVAPTDGVVTNKSVEPGQIVHLDQTLMAIIPLKIRRRNWPMCIPASAPRSMRT